MPVTFLCPQITSVCTKVDSMYKTRNGSTDAITNVSARTAALASTVATTGEFSMREA